MVKKIVSALLVLCLIGGAVGFYLWNKPAPKVENAKGITVAADALAKEFAASETAANAKYLNKAIEVTGTVTETDHNQDGGLMIVLDSGDPTAGIQCAMREKTATANKGEHITIKGFCSGSGITGVSLTDCVIKK